MRKLKLLAAFAALGISGVATAETFTITGGNWDSQSSWNTNATGDPSLLVYDNGEQIEPAVLGGMTGIVNWYPDTNLADGTYSGTIETNESGEVISGSLVVTGLIGNEVRVTSSWWAHEYTNLVIDFGAGTATATVYTCLDSRLAPAACAAGGDAPPEGIFTPIAGEEGIGGAVRPGATFDGTTLNVFREGYSSPGSGTDYLNTFTLTVGGGEPVEPVAPAPDVTEAREAGAAAVALLELSGTTGPSGSVNPQVRLFNATTSAEIRAIEFFAQSADAWQPIAIDTIQDGNGDGTGTDSGIVMLAENLVNGQIKVHFRGSESGAKLRTNVPFFNANWTAIDVAVVEDINGDSILGDAGIAVLAQHKANGYYEVRMTPYDTVNNLDTFRQRFFSSAWDVKAIEASIEPGGGDSVIIALGTDGLEVSKAQVRLVSDGSLRNTIRGWGAEVVSKDIAISNLAITFYGFRLGSLSPTVNTRAIDDGAQGAKYTFLNSNYVNGRITGTTPTGSLAGSGFDNRDSSLIIRVRDASSGGFEADILP